MVTTAVGTPRRPRQAPGPGMAALALVAFVATFPVAFARGDGTTQAKKIVLIAGPITGHPKDTHEYEKSVILIKHLLDTSPGLEGVRAEAHFRGWPEDPRTLDDADTIVVVSDGADRSETDHPLYRGDRLAVIERQMERGCGLVQLHWTTFHPSRFHRRITEWVGGYFDYETGPGPRKWYSAIRTQEWSVELPSPHHPVCRGVAPFRIREEFYHRIRFRESDPRLVPIAAVEAGKGLESVVGWAVERDDGGRGFGFTGGHFFRNWWNPDFRRLVLNAVAWTAGAVVPGGGVASDPGEPIRALIVTGHNHPAHDWRAVTAALLLVLEQDPRVRVDVTENVEDLGKDTLDSVDLVVLNYCNWRRPGLSERARRSFLRFLEDGGGLTVVHFANGAFHPTLPETPVGADWEEYRTRIVARVWAHGDGRSGHDPFGRFTVDIADTEHPITAGLGSFDTEDELYFRQEGDLPVRVLATARSGVTGKDEPVAWVYRCGDGRVFQTVLGHADVSVRRAGALIRRGSIWAAGRRPISFDPPVGLTEGALFRDGSPWSPAASARSEEAPAEKKAEGPPH